MLALALVDDDGVDNAGLSIEATLVLSNDLSMLLMPVTAITVFVVSHVVGWVDIVENDTSIVPDVEIFLIVDANVVAIFSISIL